MKRFLALFLSLLLSSLLVTPALAVGEGNLNDGGGTLGGGTGTDFWNPGMDGVRVTIVNANDHSVAAVPVDLTNQTLAASLIHFGKVCKISYNSGMTLTPYVGSYSYKNPAQALPRIIYSKTYGKASIAEIKSYFTDEQVIRSVCALTGFDYDRLVGKSDFRLVIEPIAYFTYRGSQYAMTATEAALYDRAVNGDLRAHLCSLSHKNLPLAIFLEMADLGYPAWAGSTSTAASDADIIAALGIGIVHFSELTQEPEIGVYDYEYRVNTEVVTAVTVSGGQSVPDRPVSVEFVIAGRTFTVSNVYYPEGDSQLAWVRWTTPAAPCAMTITVRARGGGTVSDAQIRVNVVDLSGSDPPNPTANDRNNGFTLSPLPVNPETASLTWGVWSPWWHAYWVWISTGEGSGYWVDCGWWEFDYNGYAASLTAAMSLTPDTKCPTAGGDTMKSGYGTNERVAARVSTTQSAAVTEAQTAVSYFPEFGYTGFWRLLRQTRGGYRAEFAFAPNHYSTYNSPAHFTPVWYRDGEYRVYTRLMDAWTPAGMLQLNLSDAVTISGDLWDDWHIAPAN